jgi:hypothetical protein
MNWTFFSLGRFLKLMFTDRQVSRIKFHSCQRSESIPPESWLLGHGCQIFLGPNIPKRGKIYQMTTDYSKRPYILPHGRKLFQTVIKYTHIFHSNSVQSFNHIGIFGMAINHLATLFSAFGFSAETFRRNLTKATSGAPSTTRCGENGKNGKETF